MQGACAPLTDPLAPVAAAVPADDAPAATTGPGKTDETETDERPALATRRTLTPQQSSGCNMSRASGSDFGALAGLFAAVLGLALSRRKSR